MASKTLLLTIGMLISGVCNTILNKLQDMTCVNHCDQEASKREYYEQPIWQTFNMFVGETLCFMLVYANLFWEYHQTKTKRYNLLDTDDTSTTAVASGEITVIEESEENNSVSKAGDDLTGWHVYLFWLPTLCDICGTTLMNVGLIYTTASVYQMLRGAVVLFTGGFSVLFLSRRLYAYHWFSLFLVVLGVTIVGMSSVLFPPLKNVSDQIDSNGAYTKGSTTSEALIGVSFVIFAQIFTAGQFVIEEKIMERYNVKPLRAVGLEGVFGLLTVGVGAIILHFTIGIYHPGGYFDISEGFHQIISFRQIWITGISICFSIAFFNFFGLAVTRSLSATSRSTIDTSRIVLVWIVSLIIGWESFSLLQVLGFVILVLGTFIFNNVISPPCCFTVPVNPPEVQPLLPEDYEHL